MSKTGTEIHWVVIRATERMQLASRLRETTLGDLLASLHRAGATGVLELIEPHARHAIHLRRGYVQAVESDSVATRLGDVATRVLGIPRSIVERARWLAHARGLRIGQALVCERVISPGDLDELLTLQRRERLERLYSLTDAEIRFRVARPLPAGASEQPPLHPRDVYHGRPRYRRRDNTTASMRSDGCQDERSRLLAVLGLTSGASHHEIRAAYKRLVLALHPDRSSGLSERERAAQVQRLVEVVQAYRALQAL